MYVSGTVLKHKFRASNKSNSINFFKIEREARLKGFLENEWVNEMFSKHFKEIHK